MIRIVLALETEPRLLTSAATPQSSSTDFTIAIGQDQEKVALLLGTRTGLDPEGRLSQQSASAPQSSPPDFAVIFGSWGGFCYFNR
jgi:hypothetical protein